MTSVRGLTRYWWLLWLASIVLTAGAVASFVAVIVIPGALTSAGGIDVYVISFLILAPVYASVGAVIVSRGAGNRVGWFISAIGLFIALQDFAGDYSALVATPQGALPARRRLDELGRQLDLGPSNSRSAGPAADLLSRRPPPLTSLATARLLHLDRRGDRSCEHGFQPGHRDRQRLGVG